MWTILPLNYLMLLLFWICQFGWCFFLEFAIEVFWEGLLLGLNSAPILCVTIFVLCVGSKEVGEDWFVIPKYLLFIYSMLEKWRNKVKTKQWHLFWKKGLFIYLKRRERERKKESEKERDFLLLAHPPFGHSGWGRANLKPGASFAGRGLTF